MICMNENKFMNKYNIIFDTDIGNSWDDQFALIKK